MGGAARVPEVGQHELALGTIRELERDATLVVDQLGVDEPVGAEVHAVLLLALAPQRDADVADAHRLGHLRAPAGLEGGAEGRLAAAGLAGDQHALDAGGGEVDAALAGPFDEMGGVRGRQHDCLEVQVAHGLHQPLGVAGADRDVAEPEPVEGAVARRPRRTAPRCRWTRSAGRS